MATSNQILISLPPTKGPACLFSTFLNECLNRNLNPDLYQLIGQANDAVIPLYCQTTILNHKAFLRQKCNNFQPCLKHFVTSFLLSSECGSTATMSLSSTERCR